MTKVYSHFAFQQEAFKKEYILGNQRARHEAVACGDDVQGNFWKLLNNAIFGFDCRDNSQNKNLHLICDEQAEIEFTNKCEGYDSKNCFLSLENMIQNVRKKYSNIEDLPEDERPFAESLVKEEIEQVTKEHGKTR